MALASASACSGRSPSRAAIDDGRPTGTWLLLHAALVVYEHRHARACMLFGCRLKKRRCGSATSTCMPFDRLKLETPCVVYTALQPFDRDRWVWYVACMHACDLVSHFILSPIKTEPALQEKYPVSPAFYCSEYSTILRYRIKRPGK